MAQNLGPRSRMACLWLFWINVPFVLSIWLSSAFELGLTVWFFFVCLLCVCVCVFCFVFKPQIYIWSVWILLVLFYFFPLLVPCWVLELGREEGPSSLTFLLHRGDTHPEMWHNSPQGHTVALIFRVVSLSLISPLSVLCKLTFSSCILFWHAYSSLGMGAFCCVMIFLLTVKWPLSVYWFWCWQESVSAELCQILVVTHMFRFHDKFFL